MTCHYMPADDKWLREKAKKENRDFPDLVLDRDGIYRRPEDMKEEHADNRAS